MYADIVLADISVLLLFVDSMERDTIHHLLPPHHCLSLFLSLHYQIQLVMTSPFHMALPVSLQLPILGSKVNHIPKLNIPLLDLIMTTAEGDEEKEENM